MIRATVNENGYLICPKCGRKTKTKVHSQTILRDFPLWCTWCKQQTIIEYRQSQEPERPEK